MYEVTDFERFWFNYPKKVGKQNARRAFDRVCPSLVDVNTMVSALGRLRCTKEWRFLSRIPTPTSWLNNHGWEIDTP